jgi:hypothetical protein
LAAFEWPVAYGLRPGRALLILLGSIGVFALVYVVPLTIEDEASTLSVATQATNATAAATLRPHTRTARNF